MRRSCACASACSPFTFTRARFSVPRPTLNDGSRRGMDRRAREGRAQRRHCARHGKHRPGARGPRDRRDVWDRQTPRFRPVASARRLDRARGLDDRATRAVPALGANSTDRARPSNLAGWTSPEKTITLASLIAPRMVRRVASKSVASSGARVPPGGTNISDPPREIPTPAGRARTSAAFFLEESTRTPPRASRRVASRRVPKRDAPQPDRARPANPLPTPPRLSCRSSGCWMTVCLRLLIVDPISIRGRARARPRQIGIFSPPFVRRARPRTARSPPDPISSPRDTHHPTHPLLPPPPHRAAAITPPRMNPSR